MKFLLITLEFFPFKGGVANYYTNLVYYWPKDKKLFILNNNSNELLSRRGIFKWRKAIFKLYHYIKKNRINHIIVGHILPLGIAVYLLSRILPFKYSIVLHGMDFAYAIKRPWKRFISRIILNKADKIISANSYVAILCSNFLKSGQKIKVVNPGVKDFSALERVDIDKVREKNDLNNHKILFSLGRLVKRKGFDNTIKSLRRVLDEFGDNFIYLIAGKGPDEKYLKDLALLELGEKWDDQVKFIGEISEQEKWVLLSLCDIFIMPARDIDGDFEGFGIVYLEASLSKKPIIAGNSGGVADAVKNGVTGLLVNSNDIAEISEAILKLLGDAGLRDKLGERGRLRALNDFSWKDKVADIYNFLSN